MSDTPSTRERVRQLTEQGLSVREIAAILNISTQAVYKHLKRIEAGSNREPSA